MSGISYILRSSSRSKISNKVDLVKIKFLLLPQDRHPFHIVIPRSSKENVFFVTVTGNHTQ